MSQHHNWRTIMMTFNEHLQNRLEVLRALNELSTQPRKEKKTQSKKQTEPKK